MHKFTNVLAVLTAGFSLCGCSFRSAPHSGLPAAESLSRVAVVRADQEAKRLYDLEPFERNQGTLRGAANGWTWQALTSSGKVDLMAAVSFKRDGAVGGVEVQMFSPPHPAFPWRSFPPQFEVQQMFSPPHPFPGGLFLHSSGRIYRVLPREQPLGIPDIMPR